MLPRSAGKGSRMRRKPRQQKQKRPPQTPRRPRHLHKTGNFQPPPPPPQQPHAAATHTPLVTEPTTVPSINDRLQNIALEQDGNAASTSSSRCATFGSTACLHYWIKDGWKQALVSSRISPLHTNIRPLVCLTLMQTLELTPLHQLLHWNHTCLS